MKKKTLLSTSALVVTLSASAVFAQQQRPAAPAGAKPTPTPASTTAQPPATPPASANVAVPVSKMAIIDTDAFLDPKQGITKFTATIAKLNGEFQKQKDDLTGMQQRQKTLEDELARLQQAPAGTPIDRNSINAKTDQVEQLKKEITRRGEDAQAAYNKRRTELFAPLQEEIGRALEAFAKSRGITIIIDASQVPLIYAADSLDVTRAFITEFNSKNPVAASAPVRP
jgi:outer membrane protein